MRNNFSILADRFEINIIKLRISNNAKKEILISEKTHLRIKIILI